MCHPLLAWKCITGASQICYTLGYNRETALIPETAEKKRRRSRMFWLVLMVEKSLSLILGRPSTIRDTDVTISRPTVEEAVTPNLHIMPAMDKWIDYAFLTSRVYDELFSPGALCQPDSFRLGRARALATELQSVFDSTHPTEVRSGWLLRPNILC